MSTTQVKIPKLRFPEFSEEWKEKKISKIFDRVVNSVEVEKDTEYQQIGIRSHGKGIFHKDFVSGSELGNKRVFWIEENLFIVNIVFAWEMAVAKTTTKEVGLIASHRFPMYKPKEDLLDLDFILYFFLRKKGKHILELASPGGAGRNKTLGQNEFAKSKVVIPESIIEQQKIAQFLTSADTKIEQLTKKHKLLEQFKKGIMHQIFNKQLRFKDKNGKHYPDWEEKKLGEVFKPEKGKGISKDKVVSGGKYPCVLYGELYTKYNEVIKEVISSTNEDDGLISKIGDLLIPSSTTTTGIDLANITAINEDGIRFGGDIIVLRGEVNKVNNVFYAYYLSNHKKNKIASRAQGITIVHIYYNSIKDLDIDLPCIEEQTQIANFLSAIDTKIELVNTQLENTQQFKKGLLQQMFV